MIFAFFFFYFSFQICWPALVPIIRGSAVHLVIHPVFFRGRLFEGRIVLVILNCDTFYPKLGENGLTIITLHLLSSLYVEFAWYEHLKIRGIHLLRPSVWYLKDFQGTPIKDLHSFILHQSMLNCLQAAPIWEDCLLLRVSGGGAIVSHHLIRNVDSEVYRQAVCLCQPSFLSA